MTQIDSNNESFRKENHFSTLWVKVLMSWFRHNGFIRVCHACVMTTARFSCCFYRSVGNSQGSCCLSNPVGTVIYHYVMGDGALHWFEAHCYNAFQQICRIYFNRTPLLSLACDAESRGCSHLISSVSYVVLANSIKHLEESSTFNYISSHPLRPSSVFLRFCIMLKKEN